MNRNKSVLLNCAIVTLLVCLPGITACGPSGTAGDRMVRDKNKTNLQRLCNLYRFYQSKHGWQGPADEATFRKFVSTQSGRTLKRMGIDPSDIDALFVSERDQEKFEIRWGVSGEERAAEGGTAPAIVFEKSGNAGMRMVGFSGAAPKEVDDSEYKRLMKN